jgi:hypothetical protein
MIRTALILPVLLGLGACASQIGLHGGDMLAANEQLGQAVRQNIVAQSVNPQGSSAAVVASGARTAAAVSDYQKDMVEPPGSAGTLSMKAGTGSGSN